MKTNLLKYYIAAFYFCSTFMMFAEDAPGSGSDNGGIDDNGASDTDPLPIDDYAWVLLLVGLLFAFFKFRAIY
jgi:hypothetical protein